MTPHLPIYMDYGATTPVDPRVVDAMVPWLREHFGNPASRSHAWGWEAEAAVERARQQVADLVGADPREIVWTSGATESNNLALKGAAHFYKSRGKHIVTVKTEHKAVLDTVRELERQGFEATYLDVQEDGLLDLNRFKDALRPDTIVASVMLVNNEIGVIQDVAAIGAICRERGIVFHVDAAQATGKVAIDLAKLPVDLMSLASHKTYGPKGIGALYVRRKPRVRIEAQMHGGGHERGMRSGTLPHPRPAAAAAARAVRCRAGVRQRPPRAARAAQPEHELQLRRGRVADHGHQGHRGVLGLGLHLGQPGAELRAARARPQRRTGALEPAHDDRPLHDGRGDRPRGRSDPRPRGQAARAVAAVGDVPGRHRHLDDPMDRTLREKRALTWHTATRS
jgi:cysteine sulfinate desulfinase/cysteine desulfurase-like protein